MVNVYDQNLKPTKVKHEDGVIRVTFDREIGVQQFAAYVAAKYGGATGQGLDWVCETPRELISQRQNPVVRLGIGFGSDMNRYNYFVVNGGLIEDSYSRALIAEKATPQEMQILAKTLEDLIL